MDGVMGMEVFLVMVVGPETEFGGNACRRPSI